MLPLFEKYFKRRPPKETSSSKEETENNINRNTADMPPENKPKYSYYNCFHGCLATKPSLTQIQQIGETTTGTTAAATTTTRTTRSNFSKTTTSSLYPSNQFTNHESLPSMSDAFSIFLSVFPQYNGTQTADLIRRHQYCHLSTHACFDYSGIGLFSQAQMDSDFVTPSTSTDTIPPSRIKPPFFEIAYKSASLRSQVQSRIKDTTLEAEIRKRIMKLLSISDDEYSMVCTANRTTAFRLLAESYTFNPNNKLLTVYDYESEAVTAMTETSRKKGADVATANFTWPGLRINSTKLRKKLTQRKKKKGLFVKKSSCDALERSSIARSIGIVNIVPARRFSYIGDDYSGTDLEPSQFLNMRNEEEDMETTSSFSGPIVTQNRENMSQEIGDVSKILEEERTPEIDREEEAAMEIECHGLDHANTLGLVLISTRLRCITNWLVVALSKLRHPNSTTGYYLVRIYGPRVKFDRGPGLAFNVFDWKGEKIDPSLVQKLGDRSGISLSCGFLKNILFENVYEGDEKNVLEKKEGDENDVGISVVNVSFGFLSSFEDAYKLWVFIAKFLDADFVEKEKWRYMALNQKMVEI
ncbi:Pyridoxal phosphate (PLP)-dependent transferases superfamily protein [Rhynchospora pubera]|uniref:Pyridoxal phosphate (PLP)-dependent transferases superfamily protein n=1 Tax=Rhynchospora pubera TaxID=906938 RepID=A0AAV8EZV8_9POAL|nr:Pyridoxal phosphate (PLP)-dependent transferases superfamily protein [Rhynchospora pubera]